MTREYLPMTLLIVLALVGLLITGVADPITDRSPVADCIGNNACAAPAEALAAAPTRSDLASLGTTTDPPAIPSMP